MSERERWETFFGGFEGMDDVSIDTANSALDDAYLAGVADGRADAFWEAAEKCRNYVSPEGFSYVLTLLARDLEALAKKESSK